jgi:hypothetical protein
MSFSITLDKNDDGTYKVTTTSPETLPAKLRIDGHVESDGQVVDLSVRAANLYASASRRNTPVY